MSSVDVRNIASTLGLELGPFGPSQLARVDADMRHVLEVWSSMDPKPIEQLTPVEARAQPTLAMALSRILRDRFDDMGVAMEFRMIPGPAGDIRARVYHPYGISPDAPMVLYIHGGGWVMGELEADDSTPRMLASRCNAVVVATHYRQGPEFKFPAGHEDSEAAWHWMLDHAEALGGDQKRAAIVGEGAGGNMAVNIALGAKLAGTRMPRHLGLVSPMTSTDMTLPSYAENAETRPIGSEVIRWFYRKALRNRAVMADTRLNLIDRGDLMGLPPTTLILAGIDPLLSEGELFADALRRSGVWVDETIYDGVLHGFFGLGRIVNKAMFAQGQMTRNLTQAFG